MSLYKFTSHPWPISLNMLMHLLISPLNFGYKTVADGTHCTCARICDYNAIAMNHLINCILYSGQGPRSLKNNHVTIYDSYHEFSNMASDRLAASRQPIRSHDWKSSWTHTSFNMDLSWKVGSQVINDSIITHHNYWKAFINLDSCSNVSFLNMKWILVCMQRSHKK